MTDFASLLQPDRGGPAHAIHLVDKDSFADWAKGQPRRAPRLARSRPVRRQDRFPIRHPAGGGARSSKSSRPSPMSSELSPWCLARLAEALPEGSYRLAEGEPGAGRASAGCSASTGFIRYQSSPRTSRGPRVLLTKERRRSTQTVRLAEATALVRDLVNTPAGDMGPAELEARGPRPGQGAFGAKVEVTAGDALAQGYPMIAAVGRRRVARARAAADRAALGQATAPAASRSSARASASTAAGSTSSRRRACG